MKLSQHRRSSTASAVGSVLVSVIKPGPLRIAFSFCLLLSVSAPVTAQSVRMKKPDRGVYQSPGHPTAAEPSPVGHPRTSESPTLREADEVSVVTYQEPLGQTPPVAPAAYSDAAFYSEPVCGCDSLVCDGTSCGGEPACGLETLGCDSMGGCDAMGCDGCSACAPNATISLDPCRWFGSLDLLAMYRSGDRLPPLLTTGSTGNLDDGDTVTLVGGDTVLKDVTVGGRLTLGTWLDDMHRRSLQFRIWAAAEESFGFSADENDFAVLTRPFFDVSDGVTPASETQVIAFPDRAFGSVQISGDSNVFGGDVSVHQPWLHGFAGSIDVLYGYQYMRLDESLRIGSSSTSTNDNFAPLGSIIDVRDSFDAENDFHGGQLGIATEVREGCWTFNGLAKLGFGSLRRSATRRGRTVTSNGGVSAVLGEGLLVQDTNEGEIVDHAFGWVPELDLSLGWHRFPHFDVKVGYHLIAMTDALQVSGMIDPDLAVNLSDPPTGAMNPSPSLRTDTFYVHGIHLGLQYVY